jgi:hypothetical protein
VTEAAAGAPPRRAGTLRRAARVGRTIVAMHVEVAVREAARDRKRVTGGIALVVFGGVLFALLLVMLQVAAACALHERWARPYSECVLAVGGADLFLGVLLVLLGRGRLRGPVMPETRSMIARTVDALTDD